MEFADIILVIRHNLNKNLYKKLSQIRISRKSELHLSYFFINTCSGPFPALTTFTEYLPDSITKNNVTL